ncbi:MAG: SDR family NAD(P)-dependent oxidoreductase [Desulfobacteraceae bacterium]|jgi:NAD(P)-dependent dehydrogenase (short-subunit alcohol dehydrogenase family)
MKDFAGKVLFVTGGASGAGFGQAKVFSKAGCKVVIADIRQDHLDAAAEYFKEKKAEFHTIKLDITDREAYKNAADEVEEVFGEPPQLLFNTAGVNTFGPPEASTFEDFDWVIGVNLGGVINGMVTFVPRMIKAGKGGHIITTASMGGFFGGPTTAPYSAAKAAVINLMESYHISLKKYGIGVSVLCPASINSNIHEATDIRPKHLENTGYLVDQKSIDTLKQIYASGMDPVVLANWVKKGIEEDQLYIIPYPEEKYTLEIHFKRIVDSVLPMEADPEGVKKRQETMKKLAEEAMKNPDKMEMGFGNARPELDWVKNPVMGPLPEKD